MSDLSSTPLTVMVFEDAVIVSEPGSVRPVARMLADIGYGQYGPAAKAIQWGIYTHQGQQYGEPNRLLMLAGCVSVWLLGISALVMWWKRRPKGRLAAPPKPADRRAYLGLAAVVLPLAVLYPLVGASIAVVLGVDLIATRLRAQSPS